jgi:hypothetical protein
MGSGRARAMGGGPRCCIGGPGRGLIGISPMPAISAPTLPRSMRHEPKRRVNPPTSSEAQNTRVRSKRGTVLPALLPLAVRSRSPELLVEAVGCGGRGRGVRRRGLWKRGKETLEFCGFHPCFDGNYV